MKSLTIISTACAILTTITSTHAQLTASSDDGYTGYSLKLDGDPESAVYETLDTVTNISATIPPPDVYLNASVSVGEIDLNVQNLTAKINLEASVLSLLQFNAGVDLSIDRVNLQIQNVSAQVVLEARLANLVTMIDDVLNSIDLNPTLAHSRPRSGPDRRHDRRCSRRRPVVPDLDRREAFLRTGQQHHLLRSTTTAATRTRTASSNRTATSSTSRWTTTVSCRARKLSVITRRDMTFNGVSLNVTKNGEQVQELEYVYAPFHGLSIVSAIYVDTDGEVVGTQVLAESSAGGSSTIGGDL